MATSKEDLYVGIHGTSTGFQGVTNDINKVSAGFKNIDSAVVDAIPGLNNFKNMLGPAGIGLAIAGAAAGIKTMTDEAIRYSEEIKKASAITGVGTDELQNLKFVAEQTETSFSGLTNALKFLNKNSVEAFRNIKSEQAAAFKELGVSLVDANGNLKTASDLFIDVTNALSKLNDDAVKTNLSMKIFGRGAAEIAPLIDQGGEAIKGMVDQADKLNLAVSKDKIDAIDNFGDSLAALGAVLKSMAISTVGLGAQAAQGIGYELDFIAKVLSGRGVDRSVTDLIAEAAAGMTVQGAAQTVEEASANARAARKQGPLWATPDQLKGTFAKMNKEGATSASSSAARETAKLAADLAAANAVAGDATGPMSQYNLWQYNQRLLGEARAGVRGIDAGRFESAGGVGAGGVFGLDFSEDPRKAENIQAQIDAMNVSGKKGNPLIQHLSGKPNMGTEYWDELFGAQEEMSTNWDTQIDQLTSMVGIAGNLAATIKDAASGSGDMTKAFFGVIQGIMSIIPVTAPFAPLVGQVGNLVSTLTAQDVVPAGKAGASITVEKAYGMKDLQGQIRSAQTMSNRRNLAWSGA